MKAINPPQWMNKEIFILAIVIPALLIRCFEIIQQEYAVNSGDITEWLINYSGGFVRRGLPGHLLLSACEILKIKPESVIKTLGGISYGLLALLLLRKSGQLQYRTILLSPAILGAPLLLDSLLLKDCIGIAAYIGCLEIISKATSPHRLLAMNLIASITILSHEMFVFFGLPFLLIINAIKTEQENPCFTRIQTLAISLARISLPIIATGATILFGRNENTSAMMDFINISYERAGYPLADPFIFPTGELVTMPWYISEKLAEASGTVNSMYENPFLLLGWIVLVYLYVLCLPHACLKTSFFNRPGSPSSPYSAGNLYIATALLHMFFFSPMYLLAIDWGRVVFVSCTAVIATYLYTDKQILVTLLRKNPWLDRSQGSLQKILIKPWPALLMLCIGLPGNCCGSWWTMFYASPVAVLVRQASSLLVHFQAAAT